MDSTRYDIAVCSLTRSGPVGEALRERGFEVITLGAKGPTDLAALGRLLRELRTRRIDILHAHLFHANMAARLVGRLSGTPVVITDERNIGIDKTRAQLLLERMTAPLSDRVTAVAQAAGEWAVDHQGVRRDRLRVIRNGVSLPPPSADRDILRQRLRAGLGLGPGAFLVLSVGRTEPVKGYEYLIDAVPLVQEQVPGIHFLVVGGVVDKARDYRGRLIEQAADLGVSGVITFWEQRDDVPDLMRASDLLVLSSLSEGLPNVVLEAMAAGLPVVATAVGGCCELGDAGRTLCLVEPRDARALAQGIVSLALDPNSRQSMAKVALDFVTNHCSWEKTVAQLDAMYQELSAEKGLRSTKRDRV